MGGDPGLSPQSRGSLQGKSRKKELRHMGGLALEAGKGGWAWWLTPVIPALWEAKVGRSPEVRNSRLSWSTW